MWWLSAGQHRGGRDAPNMSPICVIDITDLPFLPKVAPKPVWNAIAGRSLSFPSTSSVYCSYSLRPSSPPPSFMSFLPFSLNASTAPAFIFIRAVPLVSNSWITFFGIGGAPSPFASCRRRASSSSAVGSSASAFASRISSVLPAAVPSSDFTVSFASCASSLVITKSDFSDASPEEGGWR